MQSSRSEATRVFTATLARASATFLSWMRTRLVALAPSNDAEAQASAAAATETDIDLWPQSGAANYVRVGGEGQMESFVLNGDYTIGYKHMVGQIRADAAEILVGASAVPSAVAVGSSSLSACVTTHRTYNVSTNGTAVTTVTEDVADAASLDATSWRFDSSKTTRTEECWPMHAVVYAMVPRLYFSSDTEEQTATTSI